MIGAAGRHDGARRRAELLRQMGMPEEILLNSLGAGASAKRGCSRYHPAMAGGSYMYYETVAALGELTAPLGWRREDYKNFATIVSPDGAYAIAVASGTDGVGNLGEEVTTRSPKGITTIEAIEQNLNLPLDEEYEAENEMLAASTGARRVTWFLLHDIRDGVLYAELSCPRSINNGYVSEWEPRIPLTSVSLNPMAANGPDEDGPAPVGSVVDVKRRG